MHDGCKAADAGPEEEDENHVSEEDLKKIFNTIREVTWEIYKSKRCELYDIKECEDEWFKGDVKLPSFNLL